LSSFDTVEIMFEFSKAIRHGVIALESLNDLDGVDRQRVSALSESVRLAHAEATAYIVTLIGGVSTATECCQAKVSPENGSLGD
jgi:hypothetical protein